ncbi:hypothetical protein L484_006379 [Morus notabilis]|uniref:Uncharacterized protein n=1 Tax=Morus notabilis TaxID=981085 RepID=W9QZ46_9ROSA|nr:hypothetical protein L484_006379 [Morus notabilis]
MAGDKRVLIDGGKLAHKFSGRLIPKRGQVKMTVVAVLIHSLSSIFSLHSRCSGAHFT